MIIMSYVYAKKTHKNKKPYQLTSQHYTVCNLLLYSVAEPLHFNAAKALLQNTCPIGTIIHALDKFFVDNLSIKLVNIFVCVKHKD
jgi:hypothetical protein